MATDTSNANGDVSARGDGTIHLILQGKGGVGKSVIASWLAEFLISRGRQVFAHGSQLLQEVNMQLLDALNRLESAEFEFQRGFRSEPVGGQLGEVAVGSNGSEIDRKPGVRE